MTFPPSSSRTESMTLPPSSSRADMTLPPTSSSSGPNGSGDNNAANVMLPIIGVVGGIAVVRAFIY